MVPELKTLRIVLLIWGLLVIYNNLRGWLPNSGSDFEFIGLALVLCSLGYVVARRSLRTEEALLAIRNELEIARAHILGLLGDIAGCSAIGAAAGRFEVDMPESASSQHSSEWSPSQGISTCCRA